MSDLCLCFPVETASASNSVNSVSRAHDAKEVQDPFPNHTSHSMQLLSNQDGWKAPGCFFPVNVYQWYAISIL